MLRHSLNACKMRSGVLFTLSCSALLFVLAMPVNAQPGPVKKMPAGPNGSASSPAVGQSLTPERVAKLLQTKGAKTDLKTFDNNGMKIVRVSATMQQDDFMYLFDVVFVTPTNGTTTWFYTTVLNNNAKNLPLDKLQGLLKENSVMAGNCAFLINPQGALQLNSRSYAGNITDQLFQSDIAYFLRDIRETSHLWYVAAQ